MVNRCLGIPDGAWGSRVVYEDPREFWGVWGSRPESVCPEVPDFQIRCFGVPAAAGGWRSRPGGRCRGARALRPTCPPVRCWYRPCGPPGGVWGLGAAALAAQVARCAGAARRWCLTRGASPLRAGSPACFSPPSRNDRTPLGRPAVPGAGFSVAGFASGTFELQPRNGRCLVPRVLPCLVPGIVQPRSFGSEQAGRSVNLWYRVDVRICLCGFVSLHSVLRRRTCWTVFKGFDFGECDRLQTRHLARLRVNVQEDIRTRSGI